VAARCDILTDRVRIELSTGVEPGFAPGIVEGLSGATPAQLQHIEVSPAGLGLHLHFPELDADIDLPGLIEGMLGSRAWTARQLGAEGGKVRSPAKARAARKEGQKGGRPRKSGVGE
jgi:hypothetical protein